MKYLLLLTIWNSESYSYDVSRYEVESTWKCQELGYSLSKDLLSKIPGVTHVHFECVEKEYGKKEPQQ